MSVLSTFVYGTSLYDSNCSWSYHHQLIAVGREQYDTSRCRYSRGRTYCRRASARSVTAVVPYFGYARADRKVHGRESIAAKLTANLLTEAGIDRMLSIDLHSGQCVGYFDIPVDHVYGEGVLLDYLASKRIPNGSFLYYLLHVVAGLLMTFCDGCSSYRNQLVFEL